MPQFQITTQAPLIAFISIFLMLGGIVLLLFGLGIIQSGTGEDIIFKINSGRSTSLIGAFGIILGGIGIFWSISTPEPQLITPTPTTAAVVAPIPDKPPQQSEPTEQSVMSTEIPTPEPLSDTPTPVDIIAGVWSGQAKNGDFVFDISVTLTEPCEIGSVCGSFNIPIIPRAGTFTLLNVQEKRFQFEAGDFQGSCEAGAEDYLEFLSDGTLLYLSRGSYGESKGILRKAGN